MQLRIWFWTIDGRWFFSEHEAAVHTRNAWGPYKELGHAKAAVRKRWRNRPADAFEYIVVQKGLEP